LFDTDGGAVAQCFAQTAMEMLLTGEPIPARAAQQIGLVNRVVAAGTERDARCAARRRSR
jgi:enoyl-CoA hydratase/carnithine racemase